MDSNKFKESIAALGEQYGKQVTPIMLKIYWQALKGFTNQQIDDAIIAYVSDTSVCNYWPQPGMLIAKITGTQQEQSIMLNEQAANAWKEILRQIRFKGAYRNLELEDKVALKCVSVMGGWPNLCKSTDSEMQWRRKEFLDKYANLQMAQDLPSRLPGIGQKSQERIEAASQMKHIKDKTDAINNK